MHVCTRMLQRLVAWVRSPLPRLSHASPLLPLLAPSRCLPSASHRYKVVKQRKSASMRECEMRHHACRWTHQTCRTHARSPPHALLLPALAVGDGTYGTVWQAVNRQTNEVVSAAELPSACCCVRRAHHAMQFMHAIHALTSRSPSPARSGLPLPRSPSRR